MNTEVTKELKARGTQSNRDPITGAPGAHPVGTGVGAAGGAVAGTAIGAVGGPIGAAVGLVAGAVAGGLAGKGIAEKYDPTIEDAYWKTNYSKQKYVDRDAPYATYQSAYRTGYEGRGRHPGKTFEEVEVDLESAYQESKGSDQLSWERARPATLAAWERAGRGTIVAGR